MIYDFAAIGLLCIVFAVAAFLCDALERVIRHVQDWLGVQ